MAEEPKTEVKKCQWCERPLNDCTCNDRWDDYNDYDDNNDYDDKGESFVFDAF